MNGRDRLRRQWTHRRLGLNATTPTDAAMAHTEALLTAVGARRMSGAALSLDALDAALFDFVCDVDLAAGVPDLEATPIPIAALRAQAAPPKRRRRLRWQVLIPATSGGLAALVIGLVLLLAGGSTAAQGPALSATAQSKQLLQHADMLLTAASEAAAADRSQLVTEAKADLTHVSRLLPLAVPESRPEIRSQLELLDQRAEPLTTTRHHRPVADDSEDATDGDTVGSDTDTAPHGGGSVDSDTGGTAVGGDSGTPVRRRPPVRQPAGDSADATQSNDTTRPPRRPGDGSGSPTATGGTGTTQQPRPLPGDSPPPRTGMQNTTYQGTTQGGTTQQPPPGGAQQPRPPQ